MPILHAPDAHLCPGTEASAEPLRVLHLGKYLPPPPAGVEAHIDTLLRHLPNYGVEPTLVAGDSPAAPQHPPTTPYRTVLARNWGRLASAFITPGVVALAMRECRRHRCQLVHLHLPNPWADVIVHAMPPQLPIVATWHSDIVRQRWALPLYRYVQRATCARLRSLIVPTLAHQQGSTQIPAHADVAVIPYGIETEPLDPRWADPATTATLRQWAAGRPIILTVGRHVYYKGYAYLIDALHAMQTSAVLVMIGQGPLTAELQAQVRQRGLSDRVLFLGRAGHAQLVAAMHACQLFTLPSIEPAEAFGLASAEAMACGKPTVVCDLGNGVNVLNRHGVTSIVVPPRDVRALAAALDTLASNPAQCERLGQAARRHIHERFSAAAMAQATAQLYRRLLAPATPA
ncbi:glycosyltransferase [Tepidimonas aquatica]|uniref:glycosyltransferase n=1 Tax=Tepidimonas aquatica TaxID=247482 RepID=UPI00163D5724|nr:glycosyltransferase [Tepidimonas aquatica]